MLVGDTALQNGTRTMSSLNSGAGITRLSGIILTAVAAVIAAGTALIQVNLPAEATRDDRLMVVVLATLTLVLLIIGLPLLVIGAKNLARQRRIFKTGQSCLALITSIDGLENPDPQERHLSRIELAIPTVSGPATAVVRQVVPLHLVPHLGPGVRIPVRVDRSDPTFAVVDWPDAERCTITGATAGSFAVDLAFDLLN
jgi:hypothetical protein